MKTLAASLLALAACYGEGPPGQTPGGITVIFHTEIPGSANYCNDAQYLASVALSPDGTAYAIAMPFRPISDECGNSGMGSPGGTMTILSGDKMGDPQQIIATQMINNGGTFGHPHITRFGTYLYSDLANTGGLTIGPDAIHPPSPQQAGPGWYPAGLIDDGTTMWATGVQATTNSAPELEDPTFPTSQTQGGTSQMFIARIPHNGTGAVNMSFTPTGNLAVDQMRHAVADSSMNLYFLTIDPNNGTTLRLWSLPKFSTSSTDLVNIWSAPLTGPTLPMGIAADDAHVVWSISTNWRTGDLQHTCQVYSYDEVAMTTTKLLDTSSFSCMDINLDDTSAYFAIGDIEYEPGQSGTGDLTGKGLGRVAFDGSSVATLDMHITGVSRGPRRVFVDTNHVYFLDPLVFSKVQKTVLDTPLDFAP
jgi:hypothetical protein